ncbi:hypothetical protein M1N79_03330 [Dehalococcoidia bacterium]|nr:hypothetical protein [Dehalococcoidia bacterium]
MAKELVVTELLSDTMIEVGKRLVERLDESKSDVQAAFWMFIPDEKRWKLIIVSQFVKQDGPRQFYKRVVEANKKADESESVVSLNDVGVADTSDTLVNLLRAAISTGDAISGIRFSRNTINGTFIEDSYIYRINIKT